jgi:hypothetical protein
MEINKMNIVTAYSTKGTVDEVVQGIKNQLADCQPRLLLFFASSKFDPNTLSLKMKEALPSGDQFGCTTAGEIVNGLMLKNSVVAMAFNQKVMGDVALEVIENLKEGIDVNKAADSFEAHFKEPLAAMSIKKYVGIVLVDGLSLSEEKLLDKVGNLTDVIFIGGSAGDDLKFSATHVFANGRAYTNAAVLALAKPGVDFDFIKTQSFCTLPEKLVATKVNEEERSVIEFNNKPAATAYAEAIGSSVADAMKHFMHNPVGLMMENEPYVRSPQRIDDGKMVFYCSIKEGMELTVLESTDIVKDTREAVGKKARELGTISGIINFHCILRTLELEEKNQTEEYGRIFSKIPTVGFSTYGEAFIGHVTQTSTMLVFK